MCNVIIIIDVFRAFTTACHILAQKPAHYFLMNTSASASKLLKNYPSAILIGKSEPNTALHYHIPNSPTRVNQINLKDKTVLHRTEAGAKGVLHALQCQYDLVLVAGLVNADATVNYLKHIRANKITLAPMGHEAVTPSLEDDLCADHIEALLNNTEINIENYIPEIRAGAGQYFFTEDQWQYPSQDFTQCLSTQQFNFAIRADAIEDYAVLDCVHIAQEET